MFDFRTVPGSRPLKQPAAWDLKGRRGDVLAIYAHSRGDLPDGEYVFDLALLGDPISLLPVAHGPVDLLDRAWTELVEDRPAGGFDWGAVEEVQLAKQPGAWRVTLKSGHHVVAHANNHLLRHNEHLFTLDITG